MRPHSDTIPEAGDGHLVLLATPGDHEDVFTLYDDDRETYRYEEGESSTQTFRIGAVDAVGSFTLTIGTVEGAHRGICRSRSYRIDVPKSLAAPVQVLVDGRELAFVAESGAPPQAPHWRSLADRTVVMLDPIEGPAELHFRAM